ncbi:hypothetical protein [Streptomyces longhuiensis]|uniref:hypothetical protein n=1 Tax=Streptomyces longhuiensis TaxID=2880933 RepID=UPI001D0A083B|nr:hypothetical protein [Streptomyces longhuiensis]UDM00046.1 hypothetical protein LGI35_18055 [Streptomyces longhuiensis]
MTDRPYTDADLRHEAARQHAGCSWDPDYMGVGEQMSDQPCPPTDEPGPGLHTWGDLTRDEFDEAQRKIHDLINDAANVSAWAVQLGADGLAPSTEHEITVDAGRPIARMHFAFEPDMPEEMRTALVEGVGHAIDTALDGSEYSDDSEAFNLISSIASQLRDATDGDEHHAVGLIYDLAMGSTTIADARAQLAELTFRHV